MERSIRAVQPLALAALAIAAHPAPARADAGSETTVVDSGPARSPARLGARPVAMGMRAASPPTIDGQLDEPAWQVGPDGHFTQKQPDDGSAPTERTELRVLYDDAALYVAVRCFDRLAGTIVGRLTRRDRDTDADKVTLDLSPRGDRATAYHFSINAAGVQVDGVRYNDTELSLEWDGLWTAGTSRDDRGWTAEIRIPLATLRIDSAAPRIGLQVRRYLHRRQEIAEWAHIPATASGEVAHYGTLRGIVGITPRPPVYIVPYVSAELTSRNRQDVGNGVTPALRAGGDVTIGLGTGLTADLAVNPDFGQVEADQVVLNLTTFETLLPEKRPFFLSGASVFVTPFEQFYSRRVGRAPPAPAADLAEPLPGGRIWGAGKLTGTLAPGLSIGAFDAITAERDATVTTEIDGETEARLVDPLANYGVVRLQQEFGGNSAAGVMLTGVTRREEAGAAAPQPGDLCPDGSAPGVDGRCTHDAYTGGVDVRLRSGDGDWGATAHLVGSMLVGGPTALVPDGTEVGEGALGWGLNASMGKYGGERWLAELLYLGASPKLELNDAGALTQANLHRLQPVVTWRDASAGKLFLLRQVQVNAFILESWDGVPLRRAIELNTTLRLRNFWEIYAETIHDAPSQDNRELRDGGRFERGPVAWVGGTLTSDPRRSVVLELTGGLDVRSSLRDDHDVPVIEASATVRVRPASALELDVIANSSLSLGEPRWVQTVDRMDGARDYLVSDLDARSFDVTLRGTYAFTRTLSLQAYTQVFAAAGDFGAAYSATAAGERPTVRRDDFVDTTLPEDPGFREAIINASVLLRWEVLRGSVLTLFYARSQLQEPAGPDTRRFDLGRLSGGPATDVVIAKLTYLWDVFGDR